jgi:hypothetical protein
MSAVDTAQFVGTVGVYMGFFYAVAGVLGQFVKQPPDY